MQQQYSSDEPTRAPKSTENSSETGTTSLQSKNVLKIDNRYVLDRKINSGAFGKVYKVKDLLDNGQEYAAKFETQRKNQPQTVTTDHAVMKSIKKANPDALIPAVHYFGVLKNSYVLVMDLMGPSIEDLFSLLDKKFSLKTVMLLALGSLRALESIHQANYLHRDVKPDNIVVGGTPKNCNRCYFIDMGLSKRDMRLPSVARNNQSYSQKPKKSITGTVRYVSLNIHDGHPPSKWDDLQSLGYIFIYWLKGSLPWMGLRAPDTQQKYEKIALKKRTISNEELCRNCPAVFKDFLDMVEEKRLTSAPTEDPDYVNFFLMFKAAAKKLNIKLDFKYDWSNRNFDAMSLANKKMDERRQQKNMHQTSSSSPKANEAAKNAKNIEFSPLMRTPQIIQPSSKNNILNSANTQNLSNTNSNLAPKITILQNNSNLDHNHRSGQKSNPIFAKPHPLTGEFKNSR